MQLVRIHKKNMQYFLNLHSLFTRWTIYGKWIDLKLSDLFHHKPLTNYNKLSKVKRNRFVIIFFIRRSIIATIFVVVALVVFFLSFRWISVPRVKLSNHLYQLVLFNDCKSILNMFQASLGLFNRHIGYSQDDYQPECRGENKLHWFLF